MYKILFLILVLICGLFSAERDIFYMPFYAEDNIDTTRVNAVFDSAVSVYAKRFNDIRYRAAFDSVEQVLVDSDSNRAAPITMVSGWVQMQPDKIDTLYNKQLINGVSNIYIEAPASYTLQCEVDDTTGFSGNYGSFYWQDKENIHLSGGKYIHKVGGIFPGNHLFYFNGCSKITIENLIVDVQCDSANHDESVSPFMFIDCDTVFLNNVTILNNMSNAAINIYGCKDFYVNNCVVTTAWPRYQGYTCITIGSGSIFGADGSRNINVTNSSFYGANHSVIDIENNTITSPADNLSIKGVNIDNCFIYCIGQTMTGINIYGGRIEDINVTNTFIYDANYGMYITKASATGFVRRLRFENVNISDSNWGVYVSDVSDAEFINCTADSIVWDGMDVTFVDEVTENIRLVNSRFTNCGRHGVWAIGEAAHPIHRLYVKGCEFTGNGYSVAGDGLACTYVENLRVMDCISEKNTRYGFNFSSLDTMFVSECLSLNNAINDTFQVTACTNFAFGSNLEGLGGNRHRDLDVYLGAGGIAEFYNYHTGGTGYLMKLTNNRATDSSVGILTNKDTLIVYNNANSNLADIQCRNIIASNIPTIYWTQNGTDLYYDSGNVGIGTDAPTKLLDVDGDARVTNLFLENGADRYISGPTGSGDDLVLRGSPSSDSGSVKVWGGNNWRDGATFEFYGKAYTGRKGQALIWFGAYDSTITGEIFQVSHWTGSSGEEIGLKLDENLKTWLYGDLDVTGNLTLDPGSDKDMITATLPAASSSEFLKCYLSTGLVNVINQDGHNYTPKTNYIATTYAGGVTGSVGTSTGGIDLSDGAGVSISLRGNQRVYVGASGAATMSLEVAKASTATYGSVTSGVQYNSDQWLYMLAGSGENSLVWDSSNVLRFGVESSIGSGYAQVAEIQGDGDLEINGTQFVIDDDGNDWTLKATATGLEVYKSTTLIITIEQDGSITDEVAGTFYYKKIDINRFLWIGGICVSLIFAILLFLNISTKNKMNTILISKA